MKSIKNGFRIGGIFYFEAYRNGRLLWTGRAPNLIVDEGRDYILNSSLGSVAKNVGHFVALKGTGAVNATDTLASASWSEIGDYTEVTRPTWDVVDSTAGVLTNASSPAEFSINATVTVAGALIT